MPYFSNSDCSIKGTGFDLTLKRPPPQPESETKSLQSDLQPKAKSPPSASESADIPEDTFGQEPKSFKIKCAAILLTWPHKTLQDPEDPLFIRDLDHFMELLRHNDRMESVGRFTVCHENTGEFHAMLESRTKFQHQSSHWVINDCLPNVVCNTIKGSGARPSRDRGHFYLQNEYKNSYLKHITNWQAGHFFVVKPDWCLTLWAEGKCDRLIECAGHYGALTPALEARFRLSMNSRKREAEASEIEARRQRITANWTFPDPPDVWNEWKSQYREEKARYLFLIIQGDSFAGKTEYVKHMFKNPFIHKDNICWKRYDHTKHDCILFDDVKHIRTYISNNKNIFQASQVCTVHTSDCNVYAFDVNLIQKPIIINSNDELRDSWVIANSHLWLKTDNYHPHPRDAHPRDGSGPNVIQPRPSGVSGVSREKKPEIGKFSGNFITPDWLHNLPVDY